METPKQTLRELEKAPPGKRFQRLYRKRQESPHGGLKKWLFIGAGVLVVAGGVVSYPIPVIPSEIVILVGVALVAQGSKHGAIALDHIETWIRRRFAWALVLWKELSRRAKIAVAAAWMAVVAGLSYLVYRLFS